MKCCGQLKGKNESGLGGDLWRGCFFDFLLSFGISSTGCFYLDLVSMAMSTHPSGLLLGNEVLKTSYAWLVYRVKLKITIFNPFGSKDHKRCLSVSC